VRRIIDSGVAKLSNYLPAENHHFRTLAYEATQFWLPFCHLIRLIAGFCASSPPVILRSFRGMVIAGVSSR
jgi:hypothetical protein